ncbi:uncharacterized protein MAM_03985 [Metarhizium album ARSEF 1941]|uniref:Uncharacterized protein n=1 Tax=Metarhizium album (strain ARSEF 1941) TaxID=1081103 RepID=A0A0B2WXC0_METAS|nr:uncharacterized protein MAM_03985 [Metarhizium album ARSEF 1941]KHN98224.1 hypothetical protein MAM_03985 [Metarhizium album ARSEF 1941]
MRFSFAIPLLLGAAVNAAPVLETRSTVTIVREEGLPFKWDGLEQAMGGLKINKNGKEVRFLDLSMYGPVKDHEAGCHATCGLLARAKDVDLNCELPYTSVLSDYCYGKAEGQCGWDTGVYENADTVKGNCEGKTVTYVSASSPAASSSHDQTEEASHEQTKAPSKSTDSSESTAPASSPTVVPAPPHSTVASVSGTVASTVPKPTSPNVGPMVAGAASNSLSAFAAITVAILAVVIV